MRISLHENSKKNLISFNFYKIDYEIVLKIFNLLKIDIITIFVDDIKSYKHYRTIDVCSFFEIVPKMHESILIFDGKIERCEMDHEMDVLCKSKILVSIDLGESYTCIWINTLCTDVPFSSIKECLRKFSGVA